MRCVLIILVLATPLFAQRPTPKGAWLNDYATAKAEAKRTGKPMFIVIRCEPCTDFATFDAQVQRLTKPLDEVANEFIRVRLTRITGLDLSLFDFDYDLSWAALFINADETVYGRYGGRDAQSIDRRLSVAGLTFALRNALALHQTGGGEKPDRTKPMKPEEYAAAKLRKRNDCLHCHLVNEFRRHDQLTAKTWSRDRLDAYPLPENIGLTLDVDQGNLLKNVAAQSLAATAGINAGDTLQRLHGRTVASLADAMYALHQAPREGKFTVEWERAGKPMKAEITVPNGWRKTDLTWRPSLLNLIPTLHFSGEELTADAKKALSIAETTAAFKQDKFVHSTLKAAGFLKDDVIIGVNEQTVRGTMDDYLAHLRRTFLVGDTININIVREGKKMTVPLTLK